MTTLIVSDGGNLKQLKKTYLSVSSAELLLINCNKEYVTNYLEKKGVSTQRVISITDEESTFLREELKAQVIKIFKDIPSTKIQSRTLAEYFLSNYRDWWLLDISEKSIFKGRLVERLNFLLVFNFFLKKGQYSQVTLCLSDRLLKSILKVYLSQREDHGFPKTLTTIYQFKKIYAILKYLVQMVIAKTALRLNGNQMGGDTESCLVAQFSIYPAWWRFPFSPEKASEVYLGGFSNYYTKKRKKYLHLVWLSFNSIAKIVKYIRSRGVLQKLNAYALNRHLTIKDLFSSVRFSPSINLGSTKAYNELRINLPRLYNINISKIIIDEIYSSITNKSFYENYLIRVAIKKLPFSIGLLIYRLEFQPFEYAILMGLDQKTLTLGFQHSSVGDYYLSHVFVSEQLQQKTLYSLPIPDRVCTTGMYPAALMRRNGFPDRSVNQIGGLRYKALRDYLYNQKSHKINSSKVINKILILIPLSRSEALSFAYLLSLSINQATQIPNLIFKSHPSSDHGALVKKIVLRMNPFVKIEIAKQNTNIYDLLSSLNIVVTTGSTLAIEAMALGVLPVVYLNHHKFSYPVSALYTIKKAVYFVDSVETMKNLFDYTGIKLKALLAHKSQHWEEALFKMLGELHVNVEEKFYMYVSGLIENQNEQLPNV